MIQENDDKLRAFNQQWDKSHSTEDTKPPIDVGSNGVINDNSQTLLESIQQSSPSGVFTPAKIPTTGEGCEQCGVMHPPLRPGEACPNAKGDDDNNVQPQPPQTVAPEPAPPPQTVAPEPKTAPPLHTPQPTAPQPVEAEPAPLSDNNVPTEIHINKYLNSWGEMIRAHCERHGVTNMKKLMRHLTIEITDYLENYKGK